MSTNIILRKGFALVSTLFIMLILVIIALGVSKLSSTAEKNISVKSANEIARANAKLALTRALTQLQLYAGADQRVTANASILDGQLINPFAANTTAPYMANGSDINVTSNINKQQWSGVWNTRSYIQYTPDSKEFMQWLVSGSSEDTGNLDFAESTAAGNSDFHKIFQGHITDDDVYVPLVDINKNQILEGRYAYWTEDIGVKTDLSWNQSKSTDDLAQQALRLSSTSGPDYRLFIDPATAGPFDDVNFGTTSNAAFHANDHTWVDSLDSLYNTSDITLAIDDGDATREWLKKYRHDLDLGSSGVLADMKLGGLKRDLSLAFEMDGTAENGTETSTPLFNEQYGEFVGASTSDSNPLVAPDRHDAPVNLYGHGRRSRYVYRDVNGEGVFSENIDLLSRSSHQGVCRGPTWYALRDYANLYKRLSLDNGMYSITPRSYYPNNSVADFDFSKYGTDNCNYSVTSGQYARISGVDYYMPYPSRASYAPILIGSVGIFAIKNNNGNLAFTIDPVYYIWNPYDVALDIDNYVIVMQDSFVGQVAIKVSTPDDPSTAANEADEDIYGPVGIIDFFNDGGNASNATSFQNTYLVENLVMLPGEIVIVSPSSNRASDATEKNDRAIPGTNIDNSNSGLTFGSFPSQDLTEDKYNWAPVPLQGDETIEVVYLDGLFKRFTTTASIDGNSNGSYDDDDDSGDVDKRAWDERMRTTTHLPTEENYRYLQTVLPTDMTNSSSRGHTLSLYNSHMHRNKTIIPEHFNLQRSLVNVTYSYAGNANSLSNSKFFFGAMSRMAKPIIDTRDGISSTSNFELYHHFNYAPITRDVYDGRIENPNRSFTMIDSLSGSYNELRDNLGIDFPFDFDSSGTLDRRGYFGETYRTGGSTIFAMQTLPTRPLTSLIEFNGASTAVTAYEPHAPFGESIPGLFSTDTSPYGDLTDTGRSIGDSSWLINDALFDRYYLSGIAPTFTHDDSGYNPTSTLQDSITNFVNNDNLFNTYNPLITQYYPNHKSKTDIINDLNSANGEGYKKLAAYAMTQGVFNVNSTSVVAWKSLLRANRDLAIDYKESGNPTILTESNNGVPFPRSTQPAGGDGDTSSQYNGFPRLTDTQIDILAENIVEQIKLRGPFMSLSDFINRKVEGGSGTITDLHKAGTIQAALDASGIYDDFNSGQTVNYTENSNAYFPNYSSFTNITRNTHTGLPKSVTQANILLPLVSKLNARSDTFRIRAYGEALNSNGNTIASATCEAVVQRLPEYIDSSDDPWAPPIDDALPMSILSTLNSSLSQTNQLLGRRFKVTQFRWLNSEDLI